MGVYLLSKFGEKDPLPVEKNSEVLTVEIHYPYWLVDAQRLAIEQSLERYFSTWLILTLNDEKRNTLIGEQDSDSFQQAYNLTNESVHRVSLLPGEYVSIRPGFLISEVDRGGFKSTKYIAIIASVLSTITPEVGPAIVEGATAAITHVIIERSISGTPDTGKSTSIVEVKNRIAILDGTLVCTTKTAQEFIKTTNNIYKTEPLDRENIIPPILQTEYDDFVRQVANMPNSSCHVRVTVTVDGKPLESFEYSQEKAKQEQQRVATHKHKHTHK